MCTVIKLATIYVHLSIFKISILSITYSVEQCILIMMLRKILLEAHWSFKCRLFLGALNIVVLVCIQAVDTPSADRGKQLVKSFQGE